MNNRVEGAIALYPDQGDGWYAMSDKKGSYSIGDDDDEMKIVEPELVNIDGELDLIPNEVTDNGVVDPVKDNKTDDTQSYIPNIDNSSNQNEHLDENSCSGSNDKVDDTGKVNEECDNIINNKTGVGHEEKDDDTLSSSGSNIDEASISTECEAQDNISHKVDNEDANDNGSLIEERENEITNESSTPDKETEQTSAYTQSGRHVERHDYNKANKHGFSFTQGKNMSRKKLAKSKRKSFLIKAKDNFRRISGMVMTYIAQKIKGSKVEQMSASEGIKRFGAEAVAAIVSEFSQLDSMNTAIPLSGHDLTENMYDQ